MGGVGNGCVCVDSERDAILIFLIHYFPSSKRIGIKTKMHKIFQVQSFVPKISEFATLGLEWEAWEGGGHCDCRAGDGEMETPPPTCPATTYNTLQSYHDGDDHNDRERLRPLLLPCKVIMMMIITGYGKKETPPPNTLPPVLLQHTTPSLQSDDQTIKVMITAATFYNTRSAQFSF